MTIMAQAAPGTDVLQRIFTDLKSRNEESRFRAANELRELVVTLHRGMTFPVTVLSF
jgi:FKBP12-rapamycin complex-associated protein